MVFLQPVHNELRFHWQRLMVIGFLLLAAGELALLCAMLSSFRGAAGALGTLLLGAGVLHLHAVICRTEWPGSLAQNVAASLYLITGTWLIAGPSRHTPMLAFAVAVCLLVGGAYRLVVASTCRHVQWGWAAFSGCATLILGTQIIRAWPDVGVEMLGAILGIELVLSGITWLALAWLGWRNYQKDYVLPAVRQPTRWPSRITGY